LGGEMKFQSDKTIQQELFAYTHRDLIDDESDTWLYIDFFDRLNLRQFEAVYKGEGQVPIDPKLMLRTIFFGLTHGVVSGKKLCEVCRYDNRFIVLSGNMRPDRRTIDRFINRHAKNMETIFKKVVKIAIEMGLVNLGRIAIDGTRFKGNTSKNKSMKYEKMGRAINHIKEELKKLRKDLSDKNASENNIDNKMSKEIRKKEVRIKKIEQAKKKIEEEFPKRKNKSKKIGECSKSLNDSDALPLAHKSQGIGFMYGYNAQAAAEESNQIIIAADIHDKATDYGGLPLLLDNIVVDYETKPKEVLVDQGYKSANNLKELEERNIIAFIAVGKNEYKDKEKQAVEQIESTGEKHKYKCMSKKELKINARRKCGGTNLKIPKVFCEECIYTDKCKIYGKKYMEVLDEESRIRMVKLLERSRTEEFKEIYKKRKKIIEPVFGNIKNKGMKILVKGIKKVKTWWSMACTAHNIEKIIKNMATCNI
jgi:transposase